MSEVVSNSVQSIITSPPYHDLKDYGHDNEIGTSDSTYEEYLARLDTVWRECYDKLEDNGSMWVVVDSIMDDGDLKLLPYDIKKHAEEIGFNLIDMVVWFKPTSLGGLNPKNLVNKKEYIVLLSKGEELVCNDAINDDNGLEDPAITEKEGLGNLWRFPVKRGSLGKNILHKAPYPTNLAKRIIQISTDPGDTVLDPFIGSGTTAYACLSLDRKCVGYEINEDFKPIVDDRLDEFNTKDRKLTSWKS